ncbi:hypothetical protein BKA63DRAFT_504943 [Paraphoma chrysanthemicola]|nr:hypothetical protein BKA63DRAFT_504943 [Paraphoma chrysanthemicola]
MLSSTIRHAPESVTSCDSRVLAPRVVEHTSTSPLPSSRIGLNNYLPDPPRDVGKSLDRDKANILSDPIKRPESRKGNPRPCATNPIPTNTFRVPKKPRTLGPRNETDDQTVARLRQRLDAVEQEAGKRAWEDIHRRRDHSTVNEYDSTPFPAYQRPRSRKDIHDHVSREIERLRRGFVASQLNAPWQDEEEEEGDRYDLPTRAELQHAASWLEAGGSSRRQLNGFTTSPEDGQDAVSHNHGLRTEAFVLALDYATTPTLRRVKHTLPTRNLASSASTITYHRMHPPTKLRTYNISQSTPEDRQPTPSINSADMHEYPHPEKASTKVHEWAQDEYGKWELREVRDGEEDRPRPEEGVWRDV